MSQRALALAVLTPLLCVALASDAAAQMGLPAPLVEAGVDTFVAPSEYGARVGLAPRVTFHVSPRTSLTLRGDALINRREDGPYWRETRTYDFLLRRSLAHSATSSIDGLIGLSYGQERTFQPGYSFRSGTQTVTVPDRIVSERGGGYMLGVGGSHRLGAHVALVEDVSLAVGPAVAAVTTRIGLGVPIGRYTTRRGGQQALIGSRTLRTGDYVWITQDDGTVVEGAIGDVNTDTLEILRRSGRTLVETSHAQRIEIPDGVGDGTKRGALIGGVAGGVFGVLAGIGFCEDSCGAGEFLLIAAFGTGYGAGMGALIGALSDSLHGGRTAVLDRPRTARGLTISPVAGRKSLGLRAAVGW